MKRPIRLLLVDDSETILTLLQELIGRDPDFVIVGTARNGSQAISMAKLRNPDIITMDVLMPKVDGMAAIRKLTAEGSYKIVVLTTLAASSISFQALEAGALEVLEKPIAYHTAEGQKMFQALLARLKVLARVSSENPPPPGGARPSIAGGGGRDEAPGAPLQTATEKLRDGPVTRHFCGVVVAASTGGPPTLRTLLQGLPGNFPLPILLVQHMTEGFVTGFTEWLESVTHLQVVIARPGQLPQPGVIYVAPEDRSLTLSRGGRILLSMSPIKGNSSSADLLFESVGRAWKEEALAIVLTGMGRDGAQGLGVLKQMGGYCLAQSQADCPVFGMPAAAIEAGWADQIMLAEEMSDFLSALVFHPTKLED